MAFSERLDDFKSKGVAVLGASCDSQDENAAWAAKLDLMYPLLCDDDARTLTRAFEACKGDDCAKSARVTVVVDENGNVAQYYPKFGPSPKTFSKMLDAL